MHKVSRPRTEWGRDKAYYKEINYWALLPSELKRLMQKNDLIITNWNSFYWTILKCRWCFCLYLIINWFQTTLKWFLNTNWDLFIKHLTLVSIFNLNLSCRISFQLYFSFQLCIFDFYLRGPFWKPPLGKWRLPG